MAPEPFDKQSDQWAVRSVLRALIHGDGEDLLLQGLYDAAVNYMEQAGISEPKEETPRRAQYDLCICALVLDGYDRRGAQTEGSVSDNPMLRRMLTQLKLTEPVSESDT